MEPVLIEGRKPVQTENDAGIPANNGANRCSPTVPRLLMNTDLMSCM